MHGPLAIFAVAIVAAVILVAFSWHATSARITALETQLQRLADTLDQRLPTADWREELGRATKRLEGRVDERIRSERRRLAAELDARVSELTAPLPASTSALEEHRSRGEDFAPAAGEVAASEWAPDPATDSVDGPGLEEEEAFEEMFQSMYRSLGLEQERWAEVEAGLGQVLESLWPEYIALSKSNNPDTADLGRRYCARIETVLAPEEAARLGCGEDEVMNLVQPPAAGTTP
jgi:hypothetical protein